MTTEGRNMVSLIERKKRGEALSGEELRWICDGYLRGEIPDYQLAAWLMAVCWRGMDDAETLALTQAMVATGATLDWSALGKPVVDKHSTGGVGDKTSLVLVPLMAAAGLHFVKMSGRGLGHTGGTLDKLESIPGFRVNLSLAALHSQVERIGCALVGQSPELVPADGALYALRDVTGTVDSVPLIASSIMSKKLAAGAAVLVLDVKYGSGAFMPSIEDARELARALVGIGTGAGRRVRAVLSPMEQPLGRAVGNTLEAREAIETLRGGGPDDLWDLTLELGAQLLMLAGEASDFGEARQRLERLRASGAAADRLAQLIEAQGGSPEVVTRPELLPGAPVVAPFEAPADGWVARLNARMVAEAALALGAGRRRKSDRIDPAVGVQLRAKIGDRVRRGEPLADLHLQGSAGLEEARRLLALAYGLSPEPTPAPGPAYEIIGE